MDYFGECTPISIGLDFENKQLLVARSSKGDPDAYTMRNRVFERGSTNVLEIFERFDVPYGVCRIEGKKYEDEDKALVFDFRFLKRELKSRKDGYVNGRD